MFNTGVHNDHVERATMMETQLLLTPRAARVNRTELCIMAQELYLSFIDMLVVLKV
jgi:hypothetical protein